MLDALEWSVNKTRLGDTCPTGLNVLQLAIAQDHDAPSYVPREIDGVRHDERRGSLFALVRQPSADPRQLERRKVPQIDEMEHRPV